MNFNQTGEFLFTRDLAEARAPALEVTFDAMLSDRPYRKGMPLEVVLEKLSPEGGHQFDPEVLSHFLDLAARHVDDIAQIREPAA